MRLNILKEKLSDIDLTSFIFTDISNIFYFSGYHGEGMLVLNKNRLYIVTDFRYTEQARKETSGIEVVDIGSNSYPQVLNSLLGEEKKIGFEEDNITVAQLSSIKKECASAEFIATNALGLNIRATKDEREIKLLEASANATQQALYKAYNTAAFGMKEIELCADLEYFLKKNYGATPSFDFIVASGANGSMPHAVTGNRKFSSGDMITLDFGATINRYNSDMTRTFSMGKPSKKMSDIYKIVQEAQNAAQEQLAPGKACKDIDETARFIIKKYGYGDFFGHGTGHGVGLNVHEEPRINQKSETILQEGMVVTIEPGIYMPGLGGVRIENTCHIIKNGYKSFFDASTDLNIIDGGKL